MNNHSNSYKGIVIKWHSQARWVTQKEAPKNRVSVTDAPKVKGKEGMPGGSWKSSKVGRAQGCLGGIAWDPGRRKDEVQESRRKDKGQ